ncbi:MAG: N-acetylmuramoyl-L-alanine amidase [Clostridia bacterium]|nr:N-acetylmuramoyl-L-alanine amidase [Clostridia bacterium]
MNKKPFIFVTKYWRIIALILVLILFFVVTAVFMIDARKADVTPRQTDCVVLIDAGHGGVDGGVTGITSGVKESDLNLLYSAELAEKFETAGFYAVMTRSDKSGLYGLATRGFKMRDMLKRVEIMEESNPQIVVSIHMNKFRSTARKGAQVFYQKGDEESKKLADCIQAALNALTGKNYSALSGDFFICRNSECPSVIVECGFLSNKEEEMLLQQDEYRGEIVNSIFEGIMLYLYRYG